MKTVSTMIGTALVMALAAGTLSFQAVAADKGSAKGGASDLMLKPITTPAEAEALKPGDEMAMVCTKCKSVVVHRVTKEKGLTMMTVGEKHACPGCNSTIEVTRFGKGKQDQVKHVCGKCGDDSAFCCASKPGSGKKTPGME